ncbi:DUF4354 family protein [Ochrobactrum soli]|uniref:DUF4354 family protein n=1 Tax=Ochrobactrum soli TaxID=2448455 RepID=UPI000EF17BB5|nr:DUF4354 family protein [[Ochrobactrum] soli]RLL74910.1 DUF4354 family protein [[Ochrobactrum] soli]
MKKYYLLPFLFAFMASHAFASETARTPSKDLQIIEKSSKGSTANRGGVIFFKNLVLISLRNVGTTDVDLKNVCFFLADDPTNKSKVDTVEEKLNTGILKPGQEITGNVGFSAPDVSVYEFGGIQASMNCP